MISSWRAPGMNMDVLGLCVFLFFSFWEIMVFYGWEYPLYALCVVS